MRRAMITVCTVFVACNSATSPSPTSPGGHQGPPPQDSVPHAAITGTWIAADTLSAGGACAVQTLALTLAQGSGDTVTGLLTKICPPADTVSRNSPYTLVQSHDTLFNSGTGFYWGRYMATDTIRATNAPNGFPGAVTFVRDTDPAPPPQAPSMRLAGVYLSDTIPNCQAGFQQLKLVIQGPTDADSSVYPGTTYARGCYDTTWTAWTANQGQVTPTTCTTADTGCVLPWYQTSPVPQDPKFGWWLQVHGDTLVNVTPDSLTPVNGFPRFVKSALPATTVARGYVRRPSPRR